MSLGWGIIATELEPGWAWDPSPPPALQVRESSPAFVFLLLQCRFLAVTDAELVPSTQPQAPDGF